MQNYPYLQWANDFDGTEINHFVSLLSSLKIDDETMKCSSSCYTNVVILLLYHLCCKTNSQDVERKQNI